MRRKVFVATFLAPAVTIYGVFVLWPLAQALLQSLYRWRGVSVNKAWVGVDNYSKLLDDAAFLAALKNSGWLLFGGGATILVLSLLVAHVVHGETRLARTIRSIYLFPQVISLVIVAILWKFIFNPEFGIVTRSMGFLGMESLAMPWLADPRSALICIGIAFVWWAMGFYVMLFAAGLKSLPNEVMEAAELDGSSGIAKFIQVSWPMLWSVKRVAYIYVVINVLNIFALVYLMTQGGPDRATEVPLTYLYEQAFKNSEFGYATSIAVVTFVIAMTLSGIVMYAMRKNPQDART